MDRDNDTSSDTQSRADRARSTGSPQPSRYCPLCHSPVLRRSSPAVPDRDGGLVEFRFCVRCRTLLPVGLPTGPDQPGPDEPSVTPATTADQAGTTSEDDPSRLGDQPAGLVASAATAVAWQMAEYIQAPSVTNTIIDLGAGRGSLIHALTHLGYDVRGCEPSAFLCQIARATYLLGPDVLANVEPEHYLGHVADQGVEVSAFVAWHVLSRRDPIALLQGCLSLAPEATLFVEVPVAREADIGPEHRLYPTPATMAHLAETLSLEVIDLSITDDHQLRAVYRGRDPQIVDLDNQAALNRRFDLEQLETTYRRLSPAFAHFVPAPAEQEAEIPTGPTLS